MAFLSNGAVLDVHRFDDKMLHYNNSSAWSWRLESGASESLSLQNQNNNNIRYFYLFIFLLFFTVISKNAWSRAIIMINVLKIFKSNKTYFLNIHPEWTKPINSYKKICFIWFQYLQKDIGHPLQSKSMHQWMTSAPLWFHMPLYRFS